MRNSNAVESTAPLSSVPISLHRELCDELRQKTQELEVADHKNQRLVAQNQQLRRELQRLVQQVMQTQQAVTQLTTEVPSQEVPSQEVPSQEVPSQATLASSVEAPATLRVSSPIPTTPLPARRQVMRSVQDHSRPSNALSNAAPSAVPSAIAETSIHAASDPLTTRLWNQTHVFTQELQGWKMAIVMGLIVLSAFGAGFLIMRPFMARQQAQPLQPQPKQPQQPKR